MSDEGVDIRLSEREHKALVFWAQNPVEAVKDWFKVTPTDYQGDCLNGIFCGESDRVAIKSAHGTGKTCLDSWAGWIFLNTRVPSRVVATAPVQAQLHDVMWPEYAKWHARMPDGLRSQWRISGSHIRHTEYEHVWFAVARTSNRPENLQGFHHKHLMIQADEASGVPANVFEVIEGALSEAEHEGTEAILMMTGNPNFTAGEFYAAFHANAELYTRFTLTGDDKFLEKLGVEQGEYHKEHGNIYFAPRVSNKYRLTMEKKYGRDGPVWDVRVKGVFPRQDDNAVISLEMAERMAATPLPRFDDVAHPWTLVMDVARKGGDETVLGRFRAGHCLSIKAWAKTSTTECVDILKDAYEGLRKSGQRVDRVIVDEPGVGGGVVDYARREGVPITAYNGGQGMKKGQDPDEDCRMFANKRSRDWWNLRRKGDMELPSIPDDEETINQLASVHYDYRTQDEKVQVESKRAMRKRLGDKASPDRADVIVMGMAPWYTFVDGLGDLSEDDIIEGDDRPQAEMDLW